MIVINGLVRRLMLLMKVVSVITTAVYCSMAFGEANHCNADNGSAEFDISVNHIIALQSPQSNEFVEPFSLAGGNYEAHCDCSGAQHISQPPVYYKAEYNPALPGGATGGGVQLTKNLQVKAFIYVLNNGDVPVPFSNLSNQSPAACNATIFNTGSKGSLDITITQPVIGTLMIPHTKIASIYGTVDPAAGYSNTPMAEMWVQGEITVPQNCEINSGSVINIDFGQIFQKNILLKGSKPTGFTDKEETISYICNNIDEGVHVVASFYSTASPDLREAIQTTNKDIGVIIADQNGTVVPVNSGAMDMLLDKGSKGDYQNQNGSVVFKSWPVNTTGQAPEIGPFSAQATVQLDIR